MSWLCASATGLPGPPPWDAPSHTTSTRVPRLEPWHPTNIFQSHFKHTVTNPSSGSLAPFVSGRAAGFSRRAPPGTSKHPSWLQMQARSDHLRLSDHHPTNAAQHTHPSPSACSFQSPRLTPALPFIFLTVLMTLPSNMTSSLSLYWLCTGVCSWNAHSCHTLMPL